MVKTIRHGLMLVLGLLSSMQALAQGTLTGKVTDKSTGEPLPTANVLLVELQRGTTTDFDGNYKITGVPAGSYTLRVSFVGYRQFTANVDVGAAQTVFDIQLDADLVGLEELIVTGYGSQIKEKQTGNVAVVSGESIKNVPVQTFEQALQGRAAGVQITQGNGKLGQGIQVRIRGASSVSASNEPLYVIDGVPVISQNDSRTASSINPLAEINFNDIESINILKDASASAIYGSRAANGVVVITTKKGKAGQTQFNVNFSRGSNVPTNNPEWLNTDEYIKYYELSAIGRAHQRVRLNPNRNLTTELNDALNRARYDIIAPFSLDSYGYTGPAYGSGVTTGRIDSMLAGLGQYEFYEMEYDAEGENPIYRTAGWYRPKVDGQGNPITRRAIDEDWQSKAYQRAFQTNLDVSASGGDDKTRFFVSGAISDQDGILIDNRMTRFSGRGNIDHTASKQLGIGLNLGVSRTDNWRLSDDNAFSTPMQLVAQMPMSPIYDDSPLALDGLNANTLYFNGLLYRKGSIFEQQTMRTVGSSYFNYNPVPEITVRGEFGVDIRTTNEERWFGSTTLQNTSLPLGGGRSTWISRTAYNSKLFAAYDNTFNKKHYVNLTVGTEFNQTARRFTEAVGQDFPNDNLRTLNSAATPTEALGSLQYFNFVSYYAIGKYDYQGKYLVNASARIDGSSRFGADNRYGFFPSASAAWILTKESFLADNPTLSYLKARAAWGVTGNAEIGNFAHLGLYDGAGGYGGIPGLRPIQPANPDLKWETTQQYNVGIDFGFLKDRITGELDYYIKNTDDLLLNVNVPGTTGFAGATRNVGQLENRGIELVVNTVNTTGAFSWTTSFNYARNRNKITNLEGQIINGGFINQAREGHPIGVFYTFEWAGANPYNGDALWFWNGTPAEGQTIPSWRGAIPDPANPGQYINNPAPKPTVPYVLLSPDSSALFGGRAIVDNYSLAQRKVVGNPNPKFIGGITNNFSYKGFDLNVLVQFSFGADIYNGGGRFMSANGVFEDNQTKDQLDAWTRIRENSTSGNLEFVTSAYDLYQQNRGVDVPEPRLYIQNGGQISSRWVQDGSFVRLRTVTLGYNLPRNVLKTIGIPKARVYVTGINLLTWTKYSMWDPEVNTDFLAGNIGLGNDFYAAPQAKTLLAGINFNF